MKPTVSIVGITVAMTMGVISTLLGACQRHKTTASDTAQAVVSPAPVAPHVMPSQPVPATSRMAERPTFAPPEGPIPDSDFGKVAELGRRIFDDPAKYASQYVGNDLTCSNCHVDEGRQVGSAPLWAAYVSYPAYRAKNHHVNTFEERLQGCFRFSMNGKAPPLGDPVLVALESYAYWMAQGAPLTPKIPGRGYPIPGKPALPPDYQRGARVYAQTCALCHGDNGEGQRANDGSPAFPALWGADTFNWGAGMGSVANAAGFIKGNMPLGRGGTLSDQDAWDVALFMDSHERPQDPRFTGSVARTRAEFHDDPDWMYGITVNGHVLGSDSVPPGPRPRRHAPNEDVHHP
jgi:thiosulfate dehydrogenase